MSGSSITINSNLAALNAQRHLSQGTKSLLNSFSRLSSGLRINKASDDAAGLSISESLNVDARVYSQGIRNLNDGISVLAIADGAVEQLSSIVIRLQELSEQSANGTLSDAQRQALDEEAQTLSKEYFRIAQSSNFNGRYLLQGTYGTLSLQGGYGAQGNISSSLGGAVGNGSFTAISSYVTESNRSESVALGDLNNDGVLDMVTAGDNGPGAASVFLGIGDGTFTKLTSYQTEGAVSNAVALADLNGDSVLDMVTAGDDGASGAATIFLGEGDGTFDKVNTYQTEASGGSRALTLGDLNGDGICDMITAGQNAGGKGEASVFLGQGDGTFEKLNSFETESLRSFAASLGDLNGDGVLDLVTAGNGGSGRATVFLGIGDGTFTKENSYATESTLSWGVALGDLNADGVLDMVTAGDSGLGEATIFFGAGDGTFAEVATITTETETSYALALGDLNGDGLLDIVTAGDSGSGQATVFLSNGDGTFKNSVTYDTESNFSASVTLGDLDGDGVLDVVTSGQLTGFPGQASIFLGESTDGVAPLLEFSLATQAQARQALPVFQRKLDQLSSQRAQIGAFQARISVAINTLQVEQESYLAARSQIVDADIAYESAMLLRNNILQQAGTTVLAQANQSPALALELLSRI